ncbi:hypothetical protein MMC06_004542 [Schaereria dolodes]|nr:hypothetical protein [Schaereria dolodes]
MELCQCTPKDGILCQECKEEQNYKLRERLNHCAGHGCGEQLDVGAYYHESLPRICLWCALVIRHTPPIKAVYRDLKAVHDHLSREDSGVVRTYGQEVRTPGPGMTPLDHQRASLPKNKWSIVGHQRSPLTNLSSSTKKDPKAKAVYSSTSASSKLSGSLLEHGSLETLQSLFKLPSKCDVHRFRYYATDHQRASPHRSSAVPAIRPRSDNAASFRPLEISDSLSFSESFKTLLGTECQLKDAIAEAEACDLGQNMESISKAETLNDIDISEQSMMSQETLVLN